MSKTTERIFLTCAFAAFAGMTAYGVTLAATPADFHTKRPTCERRTLPPGAELSSGLITVSIYNASDVSGLASKVHTSMVKRGFRVDNVGNSKSGVKPKNVAILSTNQEDPRVRLVAAQFAGEIEYASSDLKENTGVIPVVVGPEFEGGTRDAPTSLNVEVATPVCVPIVAVPGK